MLYTCLRIEYSFIFYEQTKRTNLPTLKLIFYLATLFAWRGAKTRIRWRDWLKLVSEKNRREQVGYSYFFSVCANKVAKWKIGFRTFICSPAANVQESDELFTLVIEA